MSSKKLNEYLIRFRVKYGAFSWEYRDGIESFTVATAKEAIQQCRDDYKAGNLQEFKSTGYAFEILEVTKLW